MERVCNKSLSNYFLLVLSCKELQTIEILKPQFTGIGSNQLCGRIFPQIDLSL